MSALVYLRDAKSMTDSLTVAREFDKRHDNVIAKIHLCFNDLPADFTGLNFKVSSYTDTTGRQLSKF